MGGFSKLLEDAETPLYTGCSDYTKLTALVVLFKHKAVNGISDKAFTELLKILGDMLPQNNVLPSSTYAAKKILKTFDLGYEKIHACVNDCCLFRKDLADLDNCPRCGKSRWKMVEKGDERKIKKGIPAKVLRYFPIIPRFRRMYRSLDNSEQLLWHSSHYSKDNKIRHPVHSPQWQSIDSKWTCFASDHRNLRMGLATDGFNPYRSLSSTYSCWPVMLVNYNLPPWLCMKRENLMLTLLIPGPRQPGNDIAVAALISSSFFNICGTWWHYPVSVAAVVVAAWAHPVASISSRVIEEFGVLTAAVAVAAAAIEVLLLPFHCSLFSSLVDSLLLKVKDWTLLIGPLVDKMFAEPSNTTVVRFLSCISEQLAGSADVVFERVMLHTKQYTE